MSLDIERLAREATDLHSRIGEPFWISTREELQAFAALVLEEAAKVCDEQAKEPECPERAQYCADDIRALKGEK